MIRRTVLGKIELGPASSCAKLCNGVRFSYCFLIKNSDFCAVMALGWAGSNGGALASCRIFKLLPWYS